MVATSTIAAANKNQAKDKREKYFTILVTAGSDILKRLEQLGPSEMLRLKIDELHAMPNKTAGQEKANLLPTVQATLRRFFAVALASAPQAPPLPPIPFAIMICEGG